MANSRLSPRASFFAEVDVLCAAEAMPQRVWGQNLSETGVFLQTTKPFHPGDRLSLRFDIAESEVHVRAAEVVWVKPFEPINVDGTLPGVGVRFLSVDPPTRAAIRRYVHRAIPQEESDVPTPPPEADVPQGDFMSLESLKPLSLPPFESLSERPAFHDVFEDTRAPRADDTAVDHRVPDLAALHDSTLPSERTSPPDDSLLEATEPPHEHAQPDVEHPLSGWRFEVVPEQPAEVMPAEVMPPPDPSFSLDDDEPELNDTLPPPAETLPPYAISLAPYDAMSEPVPVATRTGFSFEDEQPGPKGRMPAPVSLTPRARPEPSAKVPAKAPPSPPPITELPSELANEGFTATLAPLEKQERGPDVFELAAHEKVDQAFFDGKLSVVELPQLEPRGVDSTSTRRLRVAWAAGLLLAGGGLGVWMGYEPLPELPAVAAAEHAEQQPAERVLTVLPAPAVKSVAEAEAELVALPAPSAAPVEQPPAAASTTAPSVPSVPIVSPEVIATSASGKLPRKPEVELTNAVAVADASPSSVRVEYGRVTIPLEGGRVARSFGLENPPRVVVDLVDATLPSEKAQELGEKGVERVRFGRPDPVHVRVVVELSSDGMPEGITTLKKASTLSVAWR